MASVADTGGVGMKEHPTLRFSLQVFAARLGVGFASGTAHNTHCPFGRAKTSHINSVRSDNSPRAGPFWPEFMSDNVALCAIPLLHCHGDCFPHLALVRAVTPPACRHPSCQPRLVAPKRSAGWTRRQRRRKFKNVKQKKDMPQIQPSIVC